MKMAVPRERQSGESGVALVPESVKKLVAAGAEVGIETGAGVRAGFADKEYESAGASVMNRSDLLPEADVLACVNRLEADRSEEHTSELQSHSFISYAVFCLKK